MNTYPISSTTFSKEQPASQQLAVGEGGECDVVLVVGGEAAQDSDLGYIQPRRKGNVRAHRKSYDYVNQSFLRCL